MALVQIYIHSLLLSRRPNDRVPLFLILSVSTDMPVVLFTVSLVIFSSPVPHIRLPIVFLSPPLNRFAIVGGSNTFVVFTFPVSASGCSTFLAVLRPRWSISINQKVTLLVSASPFVSHFSSLCRNALLKEPGSTYLTQQLLGLTKS